MKKDAKKSTKKPNWTKIEAEYIAGNISYRAIAEKYNISTNTLTTRAIEKNWYKKKKQNCSKTTAEIVEKTNEANKEFVLAQVNKTLKRSINLGDKTLTALDKFYRALAQTKPGESAELVYNIDKMSKTLDLYDRMFRRAANLDSLKIDIGESKNAFQILLEHTPEDKLNTILNDPEAPDL